MEKGKKFSLWMKKYGSYTVAGILVVALAGAVLITGLNSGAEKMELNKVENPVVSVNTQPLTFLMPMENATLIRDYSNQELYLNSTLGRWEYHGGIDLTSENNNVFAVAKGTVESIKTDSLNGTQIVIAHSNNLKTIYSSLSEETLVNVGDTVNEGQQIGTSDTTAGNEEKDGKHLHFEMLENGKKIDPANYLEFELK